MESCVLTSWLFIGLRFRAVCWSLYYVLAGRSFYIVKMDGRHYGFLDLYLFIYIMHQIAWRYWWVHWQYRLYVDSNSFFLIIFIPDIYFIFMCNILFKCEKKIKVIAYFNWIYEISRKCLLSSSYVINISIIYMPACKNLARLSVRTLIHNQVHMYMHLHSIECYYIMYKILMCW